jgi:hypothetical protein
VTSSEVFIELNSNEEDHLSLSKFHYQHDSKYVAFLLQESNRKSISELTGVKFDQEQILNLLNRVRELVLNSKEGCEYQLNKVFLHKQEKKTKHFGPPPGVVRIFSKDLASYYNGKSWKKIRI